MKWKKHVYPFVFVFWYKKIGGLCSVDSDCNFSADVKSQIYKWRWLSTVYTWKHSSALDKQCAKMAATAHYKTSLKMCVSLFQRRRKSAGKIWSVNRGIKREIGRTNWKRRYSHIHCVYISSLCVVSVQSRQCQEMVTNQSGDSKHTERNGKQSEDKLVEMRKDPWWADKTTTEG